MNHKLFSKFAAVAVFFAVYPISVGNVLACVCPSLSICQRYYYAKAVFIGKVEKIEAAKKSFMAAQDVTFSIERVFKGKLGKTEVVQIPSGRDCGNSFEIGETYFVFKEEPLSPCNPTEHLRNSTYMLKYAESLSEDNPVFLIDGRIDNEGSKSLAAEELKNTRVTIEKGETKYNVEFDKNGNFKFKTTEPGVYRVKIVLPFEARIFRGEDYRELDADTKVSISSNRTTIEYDTNFLPNGCDSRWLSSSKISKTSLLDFAQKSPVVNSLYENRRIRAVLRPV